MKNTIKGRSKTNTTCAPRQAHPQTERTVTVVFFSAGVTFDCDDESVFARVDFPESFFKRIERARKKLKLGLAEFFENAIRYKLLRDGIRPALAVAKGGAR
jgi:hypothetical protein